MPLVSRLGIMISYDSVNEKNAIIEEKKNVEAKGLEMQRTIENIVKVSISPTSYDQLFLTKVMQPSFLY
jgi:hypothetical protein